MPDEAFEWRWRILQDGFQVCGGVCHDRKRMLSEMSRYAVQYAQDGPIVQQTRTGKNKWRTFQP